MTHAMRLRFPTFIQLLNTVKGSVCGNRVNGISLSFFNISHNILGKVIYLKKIVFCYIFIAGNFEVNKYVMIRKVDDSAFLYFCLYYLPSNGEFICLYFLTYYY